jgi:hypothetical protein
VLLIAGVGNFFLGKELARLALASSSNATIEITPAAIAGAYTFVAWDFITRVQRRNLSVGDILRGALRLGIAIPLGAAFAAVAKEQAGVFIAFAVGVFPLSTVSTILRQLLNKKLDLEIGAANGASQVVQLSGVDSSIAERIEDADVTTVAQLAWCDPIQLTMRTNLDFDYIVDICSQALAWVYLDKKLDALRPLGLRGAYEIRYLVCDDLKDPDPAVRAEAERLLPVVAAAAQLDPAALQYAFDQIANDPYTQFLYDASDQ